MEVDLQPARLAALPADRGYVDDAHAGQGFSDLRVEACLFSHIS
jgi:hypothetical protein